MARWQYFHMIIWNNINIRFMNPLNKEAKKTCSEVEK